MKVLFILMTFVLLLNGLALAADIIVDVNIGAAESNDKIKLALRELPIVQDNLPIFCDKLVCTIGNSQPCHTFIL